MLRSAHRYLISPADEAEELQGMLPSVMARAAAWTGGELAFRLIPTTKQETIEQMSITALILSQRKKEESWRSTGVAWPRRGDCGGHGGRPRRKTGAWPISATKGVATWPGRSARSRQSWWQEQSGRNGARTVNSCWWNQGVRRRAEEEKRTTAAGARRFMGAGNVTTLAASSRTRSRGRTRVHAREATRRRPNGARRWRSKQLGGKQGMAGLL
jgi:hypothetical protein